MSVFYPLELKKVSSETQECVSLSFCVPEDVKTVFNYKQGQFLTIRKKIGDEELRRSYSICSCPLDNELTIAVKKLEGGKFSSIADSLKVGDLLEVMAPSGRFHTELNPTNQKHYVAIAAGSGITPIISQIKTILKVEPLSQVTLLYGNKNRDTIIFRSQLDALKNEYIDRFSLYHILSREHAEAEMLCGRIDKDKIQYFLNHILNPGTIDEVLLCGPEEMIFSARDLMAQAGIAEKNIHFELFGTKKKEAATESADVDDSHKATVTIITDGTKRSIEMPMSGESILDAAIRNGADLPFACKGGVCATCRAKLEKGQVKMDVSYGLEKDEIENGFILTCQAHPTEQELIVNFDIK